MATRPAEQDHHEARGEPRDPVDLRARGIGPGPRSLALHVVNLSPNGLMARCETPLAIGDRIAVTLPVVGAVIGEVRWALGGRIGCSLDRPIPRGTYYKLLGTAGRG